MAGSLDDYAVRLTMAGIPNSRGEALKILRHALDLDETQEVTDARLAAASPAAQTLIENLIAGRVSRIPFERLIGTVLFEDVEIEMGAGVFRAYPETRFLIEHAVILLENIATPLRLADLGTGTGCILLALLRALPQASGIGVDKSEEAVALARRNAARNQLQSRAEFRAGDWEEPLGETFDLVIANPPRVASDDIRHLLPEMRDHDPLLSLDGGKDGLDCYRSLAKAFALHARPETLGLFQAGERSLPGVQDIFRRAGFARQEIKRDYAGRPFSLLVRKEA